MIIAGFGRGELSPPDAPEARTDAGGSADG